jgi:hypothetical protein
MFESSFLTNNLCFLEGGVTMTCKCFLSLPPIVFTFPFITRLWSERKKKLLYVYWGFIGLDYYFFLIRHHNFVHYTCISGECVKVFKYADRNAPRR